LQSAVCGKTLCAKKDVVERDVAERDVVRDTRGNGLEQPPQHVDRWCNLAETKFTSANTKPNPAETRGY
jgi:hypothetical protein